jgi:hypothetical protein
MQVNGWAFSRITKGVDANAYWHPLFLRGLPTLAAHMRRPSKEKNSTELVRSTVGAKSEESPNFNLISKIAPLPQNIPYRITAGRKIQPINPAEDWQIKNKFVDLGNDDEFLREIESMDWAVTQPIDRSPIDNDPHSTEDSIRPDMGEVTLAPEHMGRETKGNENASLSRISSIEIEHLSEIDLQYLANQNRYLAKYAAQHQQDS